LPLIWLQNVTLAMWTSLFNFTYSVIIAYSTVALPLNMHAAALNTENKITL